MDRQRPNSAGADDHRHRGCPWLPSALRATPAWDGGSDPGASRRFRDRGVGSRALQQLGARIGHASMGKPGPRWRAGVGALALVAAAWLPQPPAHASPAPTVRAAASSQVVATAPLVDCATESPLVGFPCNQDTPPDTQYAVGPTAAVEMTNGSVSMWAHSDQTPFGPLISRASEESFFGSIFGAAPGSFGFTDPNLLYDSASGRWFAG